jgi:uncharacterized protein (DUF1697 family)
VKTYIQSGNVVFRTRLSERGITKKLEQALAEQMGRPVGVLVRTADELRAVLDRNPFPKAPPNKVIVFFLPDAPQKSLFANVTPPGREEVRLDGREVFVHYPDGQGRSKLKLPLADVGTGRNLNTVAKLATLAGE